MFYSFVIKKYLNTKIENAILRHMFPLTIIPPKFKQRYKRTQPNPYKGQSGPIKNPLFTNLSIWDIRITSRIHIISLYIKCFK